MTNPSEVVVSDVEMLQAIVTYKETGNMRQALATFLAKRVPDAPPQDNDDCGECAGVWHDGFNACRERVLKGG
jgi:hypothetical protein